MIFKFSDLFVADLNQPSVGAKILIVKIKNDYAEIFVNSAGRLVCPRCKIKSYAHRRILVRHSEHECGIEGTLFCTLCAKFFKRPFDLQSILTKYTLIAPSILAFCVQKDSCG